MPKTLLLADDSVTIQKVVGISFANEDIQLITVDNGDDAVTRARETRPDIVLADVVMPGKNGYEVCEAIKQDPDLAGTPVLLLTGTFETFDEDRASQVGADGHITKPFEAQALVDQVNTRLAEAAHGGSDASSEPAGLGLIGLETATDASNQAYDLFEDEVTAPSGVARSPMTPPTTILLGADDVMGADDGAAPKTDDETWAEEMPALTQAFESGDPGQDPPQGLSAEPMFDEDSAPDRTQAFLLDEDSVRGFADGSISAGPDLFDEDAPERATALLSSVEDPPDAMAQTRIDLGPAGGDRMNDGAPMNARDFDVSSSDLGDSLVGMAPVSSWPAEPVSEPEIEEAVSAPSWASDPVASEPDLETAQPTAEPLIMAEPEVPSWATSAEPEAEARPAEGPDSWSPSPAETVAIFPDAEPEPISVAEGMSALDQLEADATPVVVAADDLADPEIPSEFRSELQSMIPGEPEPVTEGSPPALSAMLEGQLHDTIEKLAWDAFGDLSERLVKDAVDRIERVAWEVIPKMAETLVREEIRRLKRDE